MSQQSVALVIGRAATDSEFRKMLFEDPQNALAEYMDLSAEERQALIELDREKLMVFSQSLDERITKGFVRVSG